MRIIDGQGAPLETQLTTLPDVREWVEGMPVELWVNRANRLVLRAYNEDGHNSTEIDVFDLLAWLKSGNGLAVSKSSAALRAT